jgi:hypothetical protein
MKDAPLVDALEDILIPFVVYGVLLDFARLRPTSVLHRRVSHPPPPADEYLPADGGTGPVLPATDLDPQLTGRQRYWRYFDWFVFPDDVGGGRNGVAAFYERYPLLEHAVKTVTGHYQSNIQLACERVREDWDSIAKAFFPNRKMQQLVKIKTTGNDFHKGGKQVLILTFEFADKSRERVVYKPSAVEIDCRVVGDSSLFTVVSPKGSQDTTGYTQTASLTELMNRYSQPGPLPQRTRPARLPTYKILPYNRTSVADAYGYIEFLTHGPDGPDVDFVAAEDQIPPRIGDAIGQMDTTSPGVQNSDWIATTRQQSIAFYHQFGTLMAMAMAVSLCDLHLQNVIVHKRSPHLIDLEEAVKWPMRKVADTYLIGRNGPLQSFHDPGSPALKLVKDFTDDVEIDRYGHDCTPAACVLYLDDTSLDAPRPRPAPARVLAVGAPVSDEQRALVQGLAEGLKTLATVANDAVRKWASELDQTLARFVTYKTEEYAKAGRAFYTGYCSTKLVLSDRSRMRAADGWYGGVAKVDGKTTERFFLSSVSFRRRTWAQKSDDFKNDYRDAAWRHPYFLLEHPDHTWRDYLNCDVPCFYHFLGSRDLRNSRGDVVELKAVIGWQKANMPDADPLPADWVQDNDPRYLPMTPIAMVDAELKQLKDDWTDAAKRTKRMTLALHKTGLEGLGTAALDRIAPRPRTQPLRSGATV